MATTMAHSSSVQQPADQSNLVPDRAKWSFTTRRVARREVAGITQAFDEAVSGDLLLAEIAEIGHHKRVQLAEGRFAQSYIGDQVVLACGDRYAADQFEAVCVIDAEGADLVAGGGLAGRMLLAHQRMAPPTRVRPIGLLQDLDGEVINLARYGLPEKSAARPVPIVGVVGTGMNSGKTTAVASLAHGLVRGGYRVAAIKATGTGAFGDFNAYRDAGAHVVADFTDVGMASTYRQPIDRIERGFETLVGHAVDSGATVIVVELADGVCQGETAQLLAKSAVRDAMDGVVFTAADALGTAGGVAVLRDLGIEPAAVSGLVSRSPLAAAEARAIVSAPILSREALCDPLVAQRLIEGVTDRPSLFTINNAA